MEAVPPTSPADRDETPSERADRNFSEALQELRVAQVGVQVLFGFLLSLSFMPGFPNDTPPYPAVLTVAMLCSAGATLAFVAPVAIHRFTFRTGRKEALVRVTQWLAIAGLALLLAAILLSSWLVIAYLWGGLTAWLVLGGLVAAGLAAAGLVTIYLRRV